jgi:hypothetical protein
MQVVLQRIDKRSKQIRKQEQIIRHNLLSKKILIDQENFDIVSVLKRAAKSYSQSASKKSSAEKPFKEPRVKLDILTELQFELSTTKAET